MYRHTEYVLFNSYFKANMLMNFFEFYKKKKSDNFILSYMPPMLPQRRSSSVNFINYYITYTGCKGTDCHYFKK